MILCVSLSPCLEVNIEVDSLSVGKINKVIGKRTFLTGKTLNVAIGLARLGSGSFATGFMYEDNGRLFEQELHKEGVTYKFVWNEGRVKETYKFIDRRSMLTEVVDEATEITADNRKQLIQLVGNLSENCKAVVISDSVNSGLSNEYIIDVLNSVPKDTVKVVDADGVKLLNALQCGVDLVKPNLEELQRTLNVKITDRDSLIKACESLVKKGAKRVLVSLGKNGAVICDGNERYYCVSMNVAMNSTAGAGDAMVSAATKALTDGRPLAEILRQGVAAGTAAVTQPDTLSFTKDKFNEILPTLVVKSI